MIRKIIEIDDIKYDVGYVGLNASEHLELMERGVEYTRATETYHVKKRQAWSSKDNPEATVEDVNAFINAHKDFDRYAFNLVAGLIREIKTGQDTVKITGIQDIFEARIVLELVKHLVPKGL